MEAIILIVPCVALMIWEKVKGRCGNSDQRK
jgi:hypothetical protein